MNISGTMDLLWLYNNMIVVWICLHSMVMCTPQRTLVTCMQRKYQWCCADNYIKISTRLSVVVQLLRIQGFLLRSILSVNLSTHVQVVLPTCLSQILSVLYLSIMICVNTVFTFSLVCYCFPFLLPLSWEI